tara:strand:+ start:64 stop:993 length:930 start_codon:yes stop_codon:yes gene_type:complete
MNKQNIPWTEKYRPNNFNNIVLDNYNKLLFQNILENNKFPNLLFYGSPGIGKTTTIINLINKYQEINNEVSKSLIIHLNASDERGIDIIRNQIYNFVNTNTLFNNGTKFVILDEVDYMTRVAQQALKSLVQDHKDRIKFCLICNYISKIDISLQNEFIKIRFNNLSHNDIFSYLQNIIVNENISMTNKNIDAIIQYYEYDIRSMINFIQSNINDKIYIIDNNIMNTIYNININNDLIKFKKILDIVENKYHVNKEYIIKYYLMFIITNNFNNMDYDFLLQIENIIHNLQNIDIIINYVYFLIKNLKLLN